MGRLAESSITVLVVGLLLFFLIKYVCQIFTRIIIVFNVVMSQLLYKKLCLSVVV